MESARVRLLLRGFVVQRLRVCDRRHARSAPAHYPGNRRRAEICSRFCYRPAGIELGVSVARESVVIALSSRGESRDPDEVP